MAIRIDIPGIGVVEVEGAASEDTMQRILAAVQKTETTKKKEEKDAVKAAKDNAKAQHDGAISADKLSKANAEGAKNAKGMSVGWAAAGKNLQDSFKNLGLTAVAVATKFMSSADEIADKPIQAGRDLINTGIDVVTNFATGLTSAIPIIGDFISGVAKATAELLKAANNVFAAQLQKNVDALQNYAKAGVSFSGGMMQMANVAHSAGLGIKDFTDIVSKNKEELNKLGMAGGDAALKLGSAMGKTSTLVGKSGQNLRTEMFKMGYTYEEQGAVMTSFMANMAASGKLRSMTDKEIAEGTRGYARDLKVISDITGQDAKKLMEKSRAESMRGSLLAELQGDAKDAFMKANSLLAKAGPDAQKALLEALTFGKVVDPKLAAQKELVKMAVDVAKEVKSGNKDILNTTNQSLGTLQQELTTSGKNFGRAVDRALVAGVGGTPAEIAQSRNQLMANLGNMFDPDAAKKSGEAAENQATATDDLSVKTAQLYDSTKKFQVLLETKVNKNLDTYAGILERVNKETLNMLSKAINEISGPSPEQKAAEEAAKKEYQQKYGGLGNYRMEQDKAAYERKLKREEEISKMSAEDAKKARQYDENMRKISNVPKGPNIYEEKMKAVPQLAEGGVIAGPTSGYQAVLHGSEAVVPLPDGKSIPVEVSQTTNTTNASSAGLQDMINEIKAGHQMTFTAMQQMISAMDRNNKLTSGILQHTM